MVTSKEIRKNKFQTVSMQKIYLLFVLLLRRQWPSSFRCQKMSVQLVEAEPFQNYSVNREAKSELLAVKMFVAVVPSARICTFG